MESYDLTELNIMVVDDYAPMRKLLFSLLRELGLHKLSQSSDGEAAIKILEQTEPDLIITDALMEPMDGLEFTRKVRNGEAETDPYVPIIMISGQTEMNYIVKARDAGVNEFLAKPISARSIYARISSVISSPRPYIRISDFFGPDRRRQGTVYGGGERRENQHKYGSQG